MNIKLFSRKVIRKILGRSVPSIEELRCKGVKIGNNCHILGFIDDAHAYLVTIGDNVTLAGGCKLLTHDGSTKKIVGYSRVGRIDIGNDVFVGGYSIVMPNVKIGNRVIIGAGSIVTKDIPDNSVAVGSPAKVIGTYDDYVEKVKTQFAAGPVWDTPHSKKTDEQKQKMRDALAECGFGFDL